MALQFEIESIDGLDDGVKALYVKHGDKYRLDVAGIDPADELKSALNKERTERKEAKERLAALEKEREEGEKKRLEEKQEFEKLWRGEQESRTKLAGELDALRKSISDKERNETALKIATSLTRDTARAELLKKEALAFVVHTPDGVKIQGQDGDMTAEQLGAYLAKQYPFLVDGNQSSGGGAAPGRSGGGATKKFSDYTGAELSAIRKENPAEYDRLLTTR